MHFQNVTVEKLCNILIPLVHRIRTLLSLQVILICYIHIRLFFIRYYIYKALVIRIIDTCYGKMPMVFSKNKSVSIVPSFTLKLP